MSNDTKPCYVVHQPHLIYEAWKVPPVTDNVEIPGWVIPHLMEARISLAKSYEGLVGSWFIRAEGDRITNVPAAKFDELYAVVHPSGALGLRAGLGVNYDTRDYLTQMAAWMRRLSDLWEGPDGCGTSGTDQAEKISNGLLSLAGNRQALGITQVHPFIFHRPMVDTSHDPKG